MALWNHPGDSVYGLAARSERVVDTMEQMLGGEVYHYHSKLTAKEPRVGGAWEWHQDYGYWYHNGIVFPLMASVMVALDKSTRENGCLQVVRGLASLSAASSTACCRASRWARDPRRVEEILKVLPVDYAELEPGDGLFFHSNVLHRSDQNRSDMRRWTVLMCYNAARNNPFLEHHHPFYTPLAKVDDGAIKRAGVKLADSAAAFGRTFATPPELKKRIA